MIRLDVLGILGNFLAAGKVLVLNTMTYNVNQHSQCIFYYDNFPKDCDYVKAYVALVLVITTLQIGHTIASGVRIFVHKAE